MLKLTYLLIENYFLVNSQIYGYNYQCFLTDVVVTLCNYTLAVKMN